MVGGVIYVIYYALNVFVVSIAKIVIHISILVGNVIIYIRFKTTD